MDLGVRQVYIGDYRQDQYIIPDNLSKSACVIALCSPYLGPSLQIISEKDNEWEGLKTLSVIFEPRTADCPFDIKAHQNNRVVASFNEKAMRISDYLCERTFGYKTDQWYKKYSHLRMLLPKEAIKILFH